MIKAIIFDFDGTLVDFIYTDLKCLKSIHSLLGLTVNFNEFSETAIYEIMKFHNLVDKGGIDPLLIHRFRLENTLSKYDITWKDKYLNFYIDTLIKLTKPYEGILELLKFLKPMVTIGLISNAYDSKEQLARIEHSGIGHFFDEILISGSFGFSKPSPEIFQGMLNRFQIGADRAIFIGDSIKYDIQGAKSVGMKSILICQNKDFISDKAYFSCNSISELSCFLSALITNQIHQPDMTA